MKILPLTPRKRNLYTTGLLNHPKLNKNSSFAMVEHTVSGQIVNIGQKSIDDSCSVICSM